MPQFISDADVERIAEAVVQKLDEHRKTRGLKPLAVVVESFDWDMICQDCEQPKDSPGHELGCDVGRKEYGHED